MAWFYFMHKLNCVSLAKKEKAATWGHEKALRAICETNQLKKNRVIRPDKDTLRKEEEDEKGEGIGGEVGRRWKWRWRSRWTRWPVVEITVGAWLSRAWPYAYSISGRPCKCGKWLGPLRPLSGAVSVFFWPIVSGCRPITINLTRRQDAGRDALLRRPGPHHLRLPPCSSVPFQFNSLFNWFSLRKLNHLSDDFAWCFRTSHYHRFRSSIEIFIWAQAITRKSLLDSIQ